MDISSINITIFLPYTVCQAAARGGCPVRWGELGAEGDREAGRAVPSPTRPRPAALQPEQQSRSGDSDHIKPQVQITRPVRSNETGWVWGEAQDRCGSGPGTGMLSTQLQKEAGATAGGETQLASQEDEAPIEAPHSSVPHSSSWSHLTPGYGRAGLGCKQPHRWGKAVAESLQGPDTVTQKSAC